MNTITKTDGPNSINGYQVTRGNGLAVDYVEENALRFALRLVVDSAPEIADIITYNLLDGDVNQILTVRELLAYFSGGREGAPGVYVNEAFHFRRNNVVTQGRFQPCKRCKGTPAVHNALSNDYVGHDYE